MDDLLKILPQHGIIDLQPLFFRLTLDTITAFLFGESVHSLSTHLDSRNDEFASAFDTAQDYLVKRFRLMDLYWLINTSRFRTACKTVHEFADNIIERNISSKSRTPTFLQSIADTTPNRFILRD